MRWFPLMLMLTAFLAGCAEKDRMLFEKEPDVRVRVVYTLDAVEIAPKADYMARVEGQSGDVFLPAETSAKLAVRGADVVLLDDAGEELVSGQMLSLESNIPDALMSIAQVPYGIGWWWENAEDRSYPGKIVAQVNDQNNLSIVVHLPLEEYLRGVVPREIGSSSPMESLKAQAVAARSETVVALQTGKYAGPGFDICPDVECQAYAGAGDHAPATDQAIRETYGHVLFFEGDPFGAYYASNCGGHSEDVQNVWPDRHGPKEYWSGRIDSDFEMGYNLTSEEGFHSWLKDDPLVYCNPSFATIPQWTHKNFRWEAETTADDLTEFVAKKKDIGRVIAIEPLGRGVSGRMLKIRFVGENGTYEVGPELAIRQVWAPPLKSAAFIVEPQGPDDRPEKFIIRGAGYGHGVGMCQTGAMGRAEVGQDYRQILTHYYRGSEVRPAY